MATRKRATKKSAAKTTKKVATKKKAAKKPDSHAVADRKTQKVSITKAIYALLHEHGPERVTVALATELAQKVNKTTKFDKWHLYFHRKNYRQLDLEGELEGKLDLTNPVIRRLVGSLKNKPLKPGDVGKKATPAKKKAKVAKATKKRVVRVKKRSSK